MRSSASFFNFKYPLISLRSSSTCLRILPRLPTTFILPCIFSSITCFRKQFLRKSWPIQFALFFFIVRRTFLSSLTVCNTSSFLTRTVQLISVLLQHPILILSSYCWPTRVLIKFLARPGRKQPTATEDFEFHISYL